MKKSMLKISSIICSTALCVSLLPGCAGKTANQTAAPTPSTVKSAEPVKISWISVDHGRVIKEDNPVIKEVEKKTNTKIEIMLVPGNEFKTKLNMLVASNTLPDITKVQDYDIFQYIHQGVFIELNSLVDKLGANIKKVVPKQAWDNISYNGKYYGIPNVNSQGKYNFFVRQDWLDNLGMKKPTNLDELTEMFKKFTFNDPDKNGQNDTYGFSSEGDAASSNPANALMPIFGAFGLQPGQYYLKDGKFYASFISAEYKEALAYIAKLNSEKVIDPDFFIMKPDQARQKLVQSKAGSFNGWWSIAPVVLSTQMKMSEVNPKAKWDAITEFKGKNGQYGFRAGNLVSATNCIAKSSKNAEAAVKLIDYLYTEEGAMLGHAGLKDVHYTATSDGKFDKETEEGKKAGTDKWANLLSQLVLTPTLADDINKKKTPQNAYFIDTAANAKLFDNIFEGYSSTEVQTYAADLQKLENEWLIKFVIGKEPISKFDEYVKQWNEKGGRQIFESFIKEYNKRKGTNYTAGN